MILSTAAVLPGLGASCTGSSSGVKEGGRKQKKTSRRYGFTLVEVGRRTFETRKTVGRRTKPRNGRKGRRGRAESRIRPTSVGVQEKDGVDERRLQSGQSEDSEGSRRTRRSKRKITHRLVVVLRVAVHDRHSVVHHHGGLLDLAAVHLRVRRRHGHGWRRQTGRRRVPVVHAAVAAHVTAGVHAGVRFAALRKVTGFNNFLFFSIVFRFRRTSCQNPPPAPLVVPRGSSENPRAFERLDRKSSLIKVTVRRRLVVGGGHWSKPTVRDYIIYTRLNIKRSRCDYIVMNVPWTRDSLCMRPGLSSSPSWPLPFSSCTPAKRQMKTLTWSSSCTKI